MIFKLKCKSCGNVISYDTNTRHDSYQKCTECGQEIRMNVEAKLDNVANMDEFELVGIERDFASTLLSTDLAYIEDIYNKATPDNQKTIVNIIDKLYLMLSREDETTNKDIAKILKDYFDQSCGNGLEV